MSHIEDVQSQVVLPCVVVYRLICLGSSHDLLDWPSSHMPVMALFSVSSTLFCLLSV